MKLYRSLLVSACATSFLCAQDTPSELINKELPKWVRVSFDHRFRMEGYTALRDKDGNNDRWFLNRLRANLTLAPTSWWNFTFQGQDSRIFFKSNPSGQNPYINRTDLRLAFTEFGHADKDGVTLRVGRQELAYGEERLIGASNWGNVARTFDAAKLILRHGPLQLDIVSASVVSPLTRGLSHHLNGNNVHFMYGKWANILPNTTLEPYVIWRVGRGTGDSLAASILHQNRVVSGFRFYGKLPADFDYVTEWAIQSGSAIDSFGDESVHAIGEHTMVRHTWSGVQFKPRVFGEFNYASGDADPYDHKAGTFDQLFPTPHEKYGLADQVGWQNINHLSFGADMMATKHLLLKALYHDWYLAQAKDGVYAAGGALLFRDLTGTSGRHVGQEADIVAQYNWGPHYIGGGFGHLFPGEFLKHQTPGAGLNYLYLNVGYRF